MRDRCCAVGLFSFMTLTGIGCAIMAWFSSTYEREVVVPLLAIVTIGLLIATICSGLKIKDNNSIGFAKTATKANQFSKGKGAQ